MDLIDLHVTNLYHLLLCNLNYSEIIRHQTEVNVPRETKQAQLQQNSCT